MSYLNILIGLGGTGAEVLNDFLKIINRYPLKENKYEWFLLDSASLGKELSYIYPERKTRFVQLDGFNSSREVLVNIKNKFPESNIDEIFPLGDYLVENDVSSHGGAWEIRKLGFLLLLYHLIKSENNIFDKIINSLRKYSKSFGTEDSDEGISGIKIFIVNSIAGGTGSGLFLPFAGFLKAQIKKKILTNFDEFPLNIYSFLGLPNFVAKGSREPHSDLTNHKYKANAYEAFLEIESILSKKVNWFVKLNDDYQFNFSDNSSDNNITSLQSHGIIVDNIFLFNDSNVVRKDIVIPNVTQKADAYKPYFQEMAWCLYLLSSGDSSYYENGPGNDLNKKGFAGIGILPLEYPKETILEKIVQLLYSKTPGYFYQFYSKNSTELSNLVKTFQPSFLTFLEESKKSFTHQLRDYRYELSVIDKENISAIKNKRPIPLKHDDTAFFKKYLEEINNQFKILLNSKYNIQDIYTFIKDVKENIEKELILRGKEISLSKEKFNTLERDLNNQKKFSKINKYQIDLFTQKFQLQNLESHISLLSTIVNDLERRLEYFAAIFEIFGNDSIFSSIRRNPSNYFSFPPPFNVVDYSDMKYEEFQNEIINEILNDYKPSGKSLRSGDYEIELLKNIWSEFSMDTLNKIIELNFEKYFNTELEEFKKNDFIEVSKPELLSIWYDFIKWYLLSTKAKYFDKRNEIAKVFNSGRIENLGLSYPFIPLKSLVKDKKGKKAIFCNKTAQDKLKGTELLGGYEQATKYPVLDTDCLLLISSLIADKRFEDLEISDLKNSYDYMLKIDLQNSKKTKPEPPKYTFIDPRFGDNK